MKLTVLIPTYNREDRLRLSMPSYLSNKREDIDFLICDNNSSDDTEGFIEELSKQDQRIRFLKNPTNVGPTRSIFRALMNLSSEYFMFLADDDYISPTYIDEVLKVLEENPGVGVLHSIFEYEKEYKRYQNQKSELYGKGTAEALNFAYSKSGVIPGITYKTSLIDYASLKLDNTIYPQVRLASHIALKSDVYCLNSATAFVAPNKFAKETVFSMSANRPIDFGIGERYDILIEILEETVLEKKKLKRILLTDLVNHAINVFKKVYQADPKMGFKCIRSVLKLKEIRNSTWFISRSMHLMILDRTFTLPHKISFFKLLLINTNPLYILNSIVFVATNWKQLRS